MFPVFALTQSYSSTHCKWKKQTKNSHNQVIFIYKTMLNILAVQRKKAILPWDDWYFSLVIAGCYSRNSWTFHLYVFYSHAEMERMRDDTTVPVNIMNCIVILTFLTLRCSCKGNTNLYFLWQYFQGGLKCLLNWTENFKLRALVKIWKKTTLSVVPHNSFIGGDIHPHVCLKWICELWRHGCTPYPQLSTRHKQKHIQSKPSQW